MDRRSLLATGAGLITGFPFRLAFSLQASDERNHPSKRGIDRRPVLVRSGFTRRPNGTNERAPSPSGMFDTEVVRSSDSEGRLAVFVFPPDDHQPYRGAPLHVHHEQDEWIYVMTGEFVAEVGGERMRPLVSSGL
jgi:mannose-6-phosphate isomerase-like protein (cupin superfamily)